MREDDFVNKKVSALYVHYPEKYLYLLPLLWNKTTLPAMWEGKGQIRLPIKWGQFFLCPCLFVGQFSTKNLIGHELWKLSNFVQILKVSTARVRWYFLLKVGTLRAKGIRKNALILFVGGSAPAPPTRLEIRVRIGKDTCPGCVYSFPEKKIQRGLIWAKYF